MDSRPKYKSISLTDFGNEETKTLEQDEEDLVDI